MNTNIDTSVPATADPYQQNVADKDNVQRPEHIPEKFWDTETNTVRVDDVVKSYTELETKIGTDKQTIIDEFVGEQHADRPKSSELYLVDNESLGLEEGADLDPEGKDPLIAWWRETAFENGYSNDQFNQGIQKYFEIQQSQAITPEIVYESLGENGKTRVEAVDSWLAANLSDDEYNLATSTVRTAEDVKLIEALISKSRQSAMSGNGEAPVAEKITKADLLEMQRDPRYWRDHDPDFCNKVAKGFAELASQGQGS